jgi:hypothetical protein
MTNNPITNIGDKYDDPTKLFVNGPINVVRLEGNVHNIKKVLYVLFDVHMDIDWQTKCDDINSIDISKYIRKQIKNTSCDSIDLFLEIYPNIAQTNADNFTRKYILDAHSLFRKKFTIIDNKTAPVKFSINEKANVRLHYIDTREDLCKTVDDLLKRIKGTNIWSLRFKNELESFKLLFVNLLDEITFIYKLMLNSESSDRNKDTIFKIINKLKKYNHTENKVIFDYWIGEISYHYDLILKYINQVITIIDTNGINLAKVEYHAFETGIDDVKRIGWKTINSLPDQISELIAKIDDLAIGFFVYFVDIYFMRRFLDKDYVTNGLSYTGSSHSIHYIDLLVKKYGFKITHVSHSTEPDINKLNELVKKDYGGVINSFELSKLLYPQILIQCSDLTGFPQGFA